MKANRMWLFSDVLEKNKRVFKVRCTKEIMIGQTYSVKNCSKIS